jgi:N-acyl-D-aspartate/D-glutamate deacylase
MLDLKISGGLVLDRGGTPAARTDVGIRGGRIAAVGDLRGQPSTRERLRYELNEGMARAGVSMRIYRWEDVLVGASPSRPEYVGQTLAQVAQREGKAPAGAMLDLLLADGLATLGIYFHTI